MSFFTFEFRRLLRNPPAMFFAIPFPAVLLLFFGFAFPGSIQTEYGLIASATALTPAYLALITAVTGLISFPIGLAEYRQNGILRRFRVTPATVRPLLAGQIWSNLAISAIGIVLCVILSLLVLRVAVPSRIFLGLIFLSMSFVAEYSIGALIASVAPNEQTAILVANIVYFPMIFLSGATFPVEILPQGLQTASRFLPLGAAVNLMQYAWFGVGSLSGNYLEIVVLIVTTVVCLALSARAFRWS